MTVGFSGDVADYYARFRRGYPAQVLDFLQEFPALSENDRVLDLGCGTGQLAVPLASRAGSVIGMDPEPDMLRLARESATGQGVGNATWVLGSDADVPALGRQLGSRSLAMAVVGQALHWMRHDRLFRDLVPLFRPGGGVAVIANGAPLWSQDTDWSRALRGSLESLFDTRLTASWGTGEHDRLRYAHALGESGYGEVRDTVVTYRDELTFEQLVGGVYSAVPAEQLPAPGDRPAFADRVRQALPHEGPFTEEVRVSVLVGRAAPTGP
ncbi:MAG: class I SAM-dependent methyltransferase [Streptomyces sp.]